MTAEELDRAMIKAFGEDYRDKTFVSPFGSFRLKGVFDEAGLRDPKAPPEVSGTCGLWQVAIRCGHPLGSSENLAVTCALTAGHGGEHRSAFSGRGNFDPSPWKLRSLSARLGGVTQDQPREGDEP